MMVLTLKHFTHVTYESVMSEGGWMPLESTPRHRNPWKNDDDNDNNDNNGDRSMAMFAIPPITNHEIPRRIDIKLFRRPA